MAGALDALAAEWANLDCPLCVGSGVVVKVASSGPMPGGLCECVGVMMKMDEGVRRWP